MPAPRLQASDTIFKELSPQGPKRRLARRQLLFQDGDAPLGVFSVASGSFKLYKSGPDGDEHILGLALPGQFLGIRALIADEPYSVSAMAREDSGVLFYEATRFRQFLAKSPEAAKAVFSMLGRQVREAREGLFERSAATAAARLAHCLAQLELQFAEGGKIRVNGQELAAMVGITPETVSRQLKALEAQGLIRHVAREIKIMDRAALLRLAGAPAL